MASYTPLILDGVEIPRPTEKEQKAFEEWLTNNNVREPFHPEQHYDYVSAFRNGIGRDGKSEHFPDTYKLPQHPTFSIESQYYRPGMKAGYWTGEKYTPINSLSQLPYSTLKELLNKWGK
jgi:hypothetical protein